MPIYCIFIIFSLKMPIFASFSSVTIISFDCKFNYKFLSIKGIILTQKNLSKQQTDTQQFATRNHIKKGYQLTFSYHNA